MEELPLYQAAARMRSRRWVGSNTRRRIGYASGCDPGGDRKCWPRPCSLSSSSSSSSSQSARGRRRTPASAPKTHSCRAFCRGADKPPPLLHLRVSFNRGGAADGTTYPCQPPAPAVWTTSPLLLAWTGPLLLGWQGAGVPRDA